MKKTSVFRSHFDRGSVYDAALILSDRHQPPEIEVEVEVPTKPWSGGLRISSTVVRRPGGLTTKG